MGDSENFDLAAPHAIENFEWEPPKKDPSEIGLPFNGMAIRRFAHETEYALELLQVSHPQARPLRFVIGNRFQMLRNGIRMKVIGHRRSFRAFRLTSSAGMG
jgi:hypothetical protein